MSQWDIPGRIEEVKRLWAIKPSFTFVAKGLVPPTTRGAIDGITRRLNLQHGHLSKPMTLGRGHEAVVAGRTLFQKKRTEPTARPFVLQPGAHNRKLGAMVEKGAWKGFPIYSLTLEERATCPRSCVHWRDCYGNRMWNATRFAHGSDLEAAIARDLMRVSRDPLADEGFVVRLHVLGDFYSVEYVRRWAGWLEAYPRLRVFGYTAWASGTPIGRELDLIRYRDWERFAIRRSRTADPRATAASGPSAITIGNDAKEQTAFFGEPAIVCPAQTGKSLCCGTCTLCWSAPDKTIAFIGH